MAVESGSITATMSVLLRTNASSRRSPALMTLRSVMPRCASRWRRTRRRNQTNQPHETRSRKTTRISETLRSAERSSAAAARSAASVARVSGSVSAALPLSVHAEVRERRLVRVRDPAAGQRLELLGHPAPGPRPGAAPRAPRSRGP